MEKSWKSPATEAAAKQQQQQEVHHEPEHEKIDGPNVTKDSWDAAPPPDPQPAPVEVTTQPDILDAYTNKWERKRIEQIKGRRLSVGYVSITSLNPPQFCFQ